MSNKKPKFSGHQTFTFRYGWLEKGFGFVKDRKNFNDDDAIVDLGVGKNMVDSIKYWCEMSGVLSEGTVTDFGISMFDEKSGWDPFLEDNASLWLLHWKLITNPEFLTAGSVIFSFLHKPEFSKRDVAEAISRQLDLSSKKAPSDIVLLRDVECYIRSYAGARRFEKNKNGESFDCPLQELGLIHPMTDAEMYRFAIGPKISLPPEIIGYTIWDYLNRNQNRSSLRIQEALYHEHSPGQVFMLDENSLIEAINILHANPIWESKFSFTESAGIALIHCSLQNGDDLLEHYYNKGHA
jgi:Protein of unknown function (DUF4007)